MAHGQEAAAIVPMALGVFAATWFALGGDAGRALRGLVPRAPIAWSAARRALAGIARRLPRSSPRVGAEDVSDMADIVRLGLTAGLSFDAALGLYCEYRDCALARAMARARLSWQVGAATREEALDAAAEESGQPAMRSFARTVVQALAMGAPLADALERQSRELHEARRAEVCRQIERAPVKILVPTGTLILPALMLAILGPLLAAGGMV